MSGHYLNSILSAFLNCLFLSERKRTNILSDECGLDLPSRQIYDYFLPLLYYLKANRVKLNE